MYVYKYVHYIYSQDLNSSKLMSGFFFFYPERRFPGPFVLGFFSLPEGLLVVFSSPINSS